jgi:hypothetical protein
MTRTTTLAVALMLLGSPVYAEQFNCKIRSANFGEDIEIAVQEMWKKQYLNKTFTVDTRDGVMRGIFQNNLFKPPFVFYHGDESNSFVVGTLVSPKLDAGVVGTDTRILTIKVWRETRLKPFSLFWDDIVFRGDCEKTS